jgi:hypothetical protein
MTAGMKVTTTSEIHTVDGCALQSIGKRLSFNFDRAPINSYSWADRYVVWEQAGKFPVETVYKLSVRPTIVAPLSEPRAEIDGPNCDRRYIREGRRIPT